MTANNTSSAPSLAILDDYLDISRPHFDALPPSKLSITVFTEPLPSYTNPSTTDADRSALVDRLKPFTIISTMRERTPLPASLLRQLPNLKLLLVTGTQFHTMDIAAAGELGIAVAAALGKERTDRRRVRVHPTTQHAWALILALVRHVAVDDHVIKTQQGGWQTDLAVGLSGKALGIVGLGKLGAAVARVGVLAWGMKVVCWSENLTQERADGMAREMGVPVETEGEDGSMEKTFKVVSKKELFQMADLVSVHYVLSERSKGIVGSEELGTMKKSAFFVNTARGPLVNENALLETLEKGKIRGAALDVFDIEPLPEKSPWRTTAWGDGGRSKVLLTPHIGYVDEDTMHTWYDETAENVERWLEGKELLNRLK